MGAGKQSCAPLLLPRHQCHQRQQHQQRQPRQPVCAAACRFTNEGQKSGRQKRQRLLLLNGPDIKGMTLQEAQEEPAYKEGA